MFQALFIDLHHHDMIIGDLVFNERNGTCNLKYNASISTVDYGGNQEVDKKDITD